MSTKLQWLDEELQNLQDAGLYNMIRTLGSSQGAWLMVDGKKVLFQAPYRWVDDPFSRLCQSTKKEDL